MNQSLRAIIDNALDDGQYDSNAYNTAEHVDTVFDTDVEKLASALEFLGGNLNNIGTADEKLADLYEFSKLAADTPPTSGAAPGAPPAPGAPTASGGTPPAPGGTPPAPGAEDAAPKKKLRVRNTGFMQGVENTWKSGVGGKAALIGGTAGLIGTGALLNSALSKNGSYMYDYDDDMDKLARPNRFLSKSVRSIYKRLTGASPTKVRGETKAVAEAADEAPGFIRRTWDSGAGGKAALIGAGTLLGGGAAYGGYRLMKKKSSYNPAMYGYDDMDKLAGPGWDKFKAFFKRNPKASPTAVREETKAVSEAADEAPGFIRRTWDSGAGGKAALIGAGTLLGGGAAYGGYRLMNKQSSFDPTEYFSDRDLHVMQKTASMYGIPTEAYAFAKMAMYEGYVTNIEDGLDMAKEAGIFDFWYGKEYNDAMRAARAETTAARGGVGPVSALITAGNLEDLKARRNALNPLSVIYDKATRDSAVDLDKQILRDEQAFARQSAAEARLTAAQQAEEGVRAGRKNIFRRGADAIRRGAASVQADINTRRASRGGEYIDDVTAPSSTPIQTREAVKEMAGGGADDAARGAGMADDAARGAGMADDAARGAGKPGFLRAHGGKLAIGAGALALGGGAYALNRRRRNRG